jgi:hypothetical protein
VHLVRNSSDGLPVDIVDGLPDCLYYITLSTYGLRVQCVGFRARSVYGKGFLSKLATQETPSRRCFVWLPLALVLCWYIKVFTTSTCQAGHRNSFRFHRCFRSLTPKLFMAADDFYVRYYIGHKGKFGHEFLEFEFRPDGQVRGFCFASLVDTLAANVI